MPELDPIKIKVQVEYDPAGLDQAKEDLAKLSDIGGSSGDAVGGLTENLAALDEQAASSAESAKSFTAAIEELPKIAESGTTSVADMTSAVDEHTAAVEEATSAHEDLQSVVADTTDVLQKATPAMQSVTKETQAMTEQVGAVSENMSVFQDALVTPEPYQMVSSYLNETGQTWGDFASSIGDSNLSILRSNDAFRSDVQQMGDVLPIYSSNAEDYSNFVRDMASSGGQIANSIDWQTVGPPTNFMSGLENAKTSMMQLGGATESTGTQLDQASVAALNWAKGINEFGGVGASLYGPSTAMSEWMSGEASSIFGMGGLMGMIGDFMMPMFAVQMIGMGVQQLGQSIYNAAAIAEGPAAHGVGTFTGAVDVLNQSVQKSGQSFSENFGRGVLPTLDAINNATAQNSGGFDFWGNLGRGFGMEVGLGAGFIDLMTGNLSGAGAHGLANYYANFTGQPEPYPSPAPPSQADTYYQQQMQNLPNTIQMSGAQLRAQGTIMLAQAADPTWEADYNQYTADQRATQYLVQQYQSRHPISMQQAIMNAQYEDYAAQQNLLAQQYDTSGGGGGLLDNILGYTSPAYALYKSGALSFAGGSGGWGGQTYGQAIGGWFSNLFGGIGADIGGFFNFLGSGGAPSSSVGGGCFVAGTKVLLANGDTKPIETLQTGEEVQTHDGAQRITACMTYPAKQTYELVFSDGTTLLTTDSHPISTVDGWKSISPASTKRENPDLPVDRLVIWDIVETIHGPRELLSIQKRAIVQVYNITVANTHTYYANGVLVHNAKGFTPGGEGSEQVSLSHTFTAQVTWAAENLEKSFTGTASWIGQGLENTFMGAASWVGQNLENTFMGAATWVGQNLENTFMGMASWAGQNLENTFVGVGNWVGQNLGHDFEGVAAWVGENLEHTFNAVAQWTAENLTPNFTVNPSVTMLAEGASNFAGGPALVAEAGYPEVVEHNGKYSVFNQATLLNLPAGANVYPMKNVTPFADGTGGGSITIGGNNTPQTLNLHVHVGDATFSHMGIALAQDMRLMAGIRGY